MVCWYESALLFITSCLVRIYAVDPSCECVVFQSYGLSKGKFYSPNYPTPYKPGINCILYSFIGDFNEIVEIKFLSMDLRQPTIHGCMDRLRIFQQLDRPVVNEHSQYDEELCGNMSNLEEKTFYSRGRALILEFHTDNYSNGTFLGFKGIYTFLEKRTFVTPGLVPGHICRYFIQSGHNNTRGSFFSPRFPLKYPKSSNCQYIFSGLENEKVTVTFKHIRLPKHGSRCVDAGDTIIIYDGKNSSAKLLEAFCDTDNSKYVTSSGPYMYIEFRSDRHHEKQGFAAEFVFADASLTPTQRHEDGTELQNPESESYNVINGGDPAHHCSKTFDSKTAHRKNGTASSLNYPTTYPMAIECVYLFVAEGRERVQLNFTHMDLHYTNGDAMDPFGCETQDRVIVYVKLKKEEWQALGTYCGKKLPTPFMSAGREMKVVFKSESSPKDNNVSGFKLKYYFRTDYAVSGTGVQDQRMVCTFMFRSRVRKHGYFTSPNFGGWYPKDTACHYIFFGRRNERVQIHFPVFDVDGIVPRCGSRTKSDSVSFSNFKDVEDSMMPTYCGTKPRTDIITSDGAFFKVTFRSNEKFDAKGFKGKYTFVPSEESMTPATSTQGGSSASCLPCISHELITLLLLLCKTVITIS